MTTLLARVLPRNLQGLDVVERQQATAMVVVILSGLVVTGLRAIEMLVVPSPAALWPLLGVVVVALSTLLWVIRRGHIDRAVTLGLAIGFVLSAAWPLTEGPDSARAAWLAVVVIAAAGMVRPWAAITYTALSVALLGGLVLAELLEWITPYAAIPVRDWTITARQLGMWGFLCAVFAFGMRRTLASLAQREAELRARVNEVRASQSAQASSDARFETMVRSSPDGIAGVDLTGRIASANPALARLLGRTPGALPGTPIDELGLGALSGVSLGGAPAECTVVTPGNGVRWVEVVRRELGAGAGELLLIRDIDARKQAERLTGELRQSQKLEALGRLAGGIAHDFNNMLTAIQGGVSLLEEEPGIPQDILRPVASAARRAAGVTRRLLSFAKRESGGARTLDLRAPVQDLQPMLRRLIGENIEFEVLVPATPAWIQADPVLIDQVVLNLVVNAQDAMPGGGRLTVTVLAPLGESFAEIQVRDTGDGIAPDVLPRVFEPFFTTKGPSEGTGLGLSMVREIVIGLGGSVTVDSRLGQWTEFAVRLPLTAPPEARHTDQIPAPAVGGSETILVVDDDELVRETIQSVLQRQGYRVLVAHDADSAIAAVQGCDTVIDLLVSDVVLARGSGPEVARRLAQVCPDLRVLFVSGYTAGVMERHGVSKEAPLLPKPFEPVVLGKAVRRALDKPSDRAPLVSRILPGAPGP